jgi:outer membrane protein OmpA-like peptidoglycan-associated protein
MALGYEYKQFRLAVESGYANFEGTNPLVLDITLIPLSLKFGYEYPINFGFGVQADLLAGYFFTKVIRYETAIDVITENVREDSETNFFTGARLYATWSTKDNFLKIYAGGGADFVFERDGLITLALLEIGIHIHPLKLIPHKKPQPQIAEPEPEVYEEPEPEIETYDEPQIEIYEEPEPPPEPVRLLWLALFAPDKTTPDKEGLETLDQAAAVIADAEGEYTIVLRGYAAPLVNVAGQNEVSRRRAVFCKRYFIEKYGIAEDRITIEWCGSKKLPENVTERAYPRRRSVEIIFEGVIPEKKNNLTAEQTEQEVTSVLPEAAEPVEADEEGETLLQTQSPAENTEQEKGEE